MKENFRKLVLSLFCFLSIAIQAQQTLNTSCNKMRADDNLIKQQVEYKLPGRSGSDVIWDFSSQKPINENYRLSYIDAADSMIIGREHNTSYQYRLQKDSLFLLGYRNATTTFNYCRPELLLSFPFSYENSAEDYFYGTGSYCGNIDLESQGKTIIKADAYGMIILPELDTLKHVLRIHTTKQISERMRLHSYSDKKDSCIFNLDSINSHLLNDSNYIVVETYQWYAEGYRYPIFETIESTIYKQRKPIKCFNSAFYYSPDEHSILEDDPINRNKLEAEEERLRLAEKSKKNDGSFTDEESSGTIHYNAYLATDNNSLIIEYFLDIPMDVAFILFDMQGRMLTGLPRAKQDAGFYKEILSLDNFQHGEYLLRISADKNVFSEKIVKRINIY